MLSNHRIAELVTELNLSKEFILLVENIAQELDDKQIATGIALGEKAPDFCLQNQHGQAISLHEVLQTSPVVLSFYRGDWCPICRAELTAQQEALAEITATGCRLLAIAPQTAEKGQQLYQKLDLEFDLLSDPDQAVIKNYRLQFEVPQVWQKFHQGLLKQENLHGSWNLTIPATFVLNQQGIVCGRYVSADYLKRMEPLEIIETLERLLGKDEALSSYLFSKNEILRNTLKELQFTQKKLLKQQKKAVIGDLTAGLIHEIKNLLNPIGFLEFIKDEISAENQEYVGFIYDSRTRILELIDEVRLLAKDEEVSYSTSNYELNAVIQEAVKLSLLDNEVKNQAIHLELDYPGAVQINKNKIIQVLLNLIRNAAHAQGATAGKIIIKTCTEDDFAKVSVIDNGMGMEKEVLDKIWQPFFTTKGDIGTGLGLSVCRNIIENHGGKIACESQKNVGTEFNFSLSLAIDV